MSPSFAARAGALLWIITHSHRSKITLHIAQTWNKFCLPSDLASQLVVLPLLRPSLQPGDSGLLGIRETMTEAASFFVTRCACRCEVWTRWQLGGSGPRSEESKVRALFMERKLESGKRRRKKDMCFSKMTDRVRLRDYSRLASAQARPLPHLWRHPVSWMRAGILPVSCRNPAAVLLRCFGTKALPLRASSSPPLLRWKKCARGRVAAALRIDSWVTEEARDIIQTKAHVIMWQAGEAFEIRFKR